MLLSKTAIAAALVAIYFSWSFFQMYDVSRVPHPLGGDDVEVLPWTQGDDEVEVHFLMSRAVSRLNFDENLTALLDDLPAGTFLVSTTKLRMRERKKSDMTIPEPLRANATVFLRALVTTPETRRLIQPSPSLLLSRFLVPQKKLKPTRLLMREDFKYTVEHQVPESSVPPRIVASFVSESRPLSLTQLRSRNPGILSSFQTRQGKLKYSRPRPFEDQREYYNIPLTLNPHVTPSDAYRPLSDMTHITVEFEPTGFVHWSLQNRIIGNLEQVAKKFQQSEYDTDSIKMMVAGSHLAIVVTTLIVSVLHVIFEVFSVSHDFSWWRSQEAKTLRGLSANTYLLDLLFTTISALYLWDSDESKLVMVFIVARVGMDLWKIMKLGAFKITNRFPFLLVVRHDAVGGSATPEDLELQNFEAGSMKFIGAVIAIPMFGVSLYQLVFIPQRGWASWIIYSLALCAYAGGFVTMTPQVLRNHYMKSAEHLPWRVLTYQAINTFIDDLFSLIIRMPQIHKVSVFRDDIVFIVYQYQRWIYRKKGEEKEESEKKKEK